MHSLVFDYQITNAECMAAIIAALSQVTTTLAHMNIEQNNKIKSNRIYAKSVIVYNQKKSLACISISIPYTRSRGLHSYPRRHLRVFFVDLCIAMCTSAAVRLYTQRGRSPPLLQQFIPVRQSGRRFAFVQRR